MPDSQHIVAALLLACGLGPALAPPAHAQAADPYASQALGSLGGLRPWLATLGASLSVNETADLLGNPSGGFRQAVDFQGLAVATLTLDTGKFLGWPGGLFNVSAEQIHGRNLDSDALGDLHSNTSTLSVRGTRLWELWYQQSLGPDFNVRAGLQSIDQEYMISPTSASFVNANFGWPLLPSQDLPNGGPIYPLSALGLRLEATPRPWLKLLAGVYNGSPVAAGCNQAPPLCDPSGTQFPLNGGQLAITELQLAPPGWNLPGHFKLGGWYDSERFSVNAFAAPPAAISPAPTYPGDWSVYAVADQMVWKGKAGRNLILFSRAFMAPSDRNPIALELAGGALLKAPLADRPNDSAGLAVDYGGIGDAVRRIDLEAEQAGLGHFARTEETVVEASYQAAITRWLQLQPDIQYIWNPGGGVANPLMPTRRLANETVLILRASVGF